ncbi:MAG: HNH endonuclease [Nitrosomonas sp.]|nr:HNH endonuclease [Nitrosomonas sp.]UJO99391.1 MAG: HNH endonuclease [Nitrosomonas sp.]UJP08343.1 MAG: HNH endonuclease [Nitrosomonas sp.]
MTSSQNLNYFPNSCIISADGKPDQHGYAVLATSRSRSVRAHRIAYRLFKGKIPEGTVVMHTCDSPLCINPKRLAAGTHADNYADMMIKGRNVRGEGLWSAKLTEKDVKDIRLARLSNESYREIAKRYSVTKATIIAVIKGRTWKHISVEGV